MPRKTTATKPAGRTRVASTVPDAEPCETCKGEGVVPKPITRRREVPGQSAICLTCLGSGLAS
jgi:DnaJ-class molecular chaperone